MSDVKTLYLRLRGMPWPTLAGRVGDFPLYESLLAGYADRVVHGDLTDVSSVPTPDDETVAYVRKLRTKTDRAEEEIDFLEYFDLLEEIRSCLVYQRGRNG